MKTLSEILTVILVFILMSGCTGRDSGKISSDTMPDTISVPDTGYTGIKKYYSGDHLVKEVTFKNGIREGLMRSFYQTGELYQTFWYENGVREDSAKWYYQEGQVFRSTPYVNDTLDGIQKQYYRTGKLKAQIGYRKGLRTTFFEEYTQDGKLFKSYPTIVSTATDEYNTNGTYKINLELSDKSTRVKYYIGDFTDGLFDTSRYKAINTLNGKGSISLKKTGSATSGTVSVIAELTTSAGNKYLTSQKISLPYNDLK